MNENRNSFKGSIGFVLAAAGSAVGLGNIWRFPYLAAKDGGGLFLVIYIVLALTFGFTLLTTEIAIGRKTKQSPLTAYSKLKSKWKPLGIIACIVPIMIFPYYVTIGGWVLKYLLVYITGNGHAAAQDGYFSGFIGQTAEPIIMMLVFTIIVAFIIFRGVNSGIESSSKIIMPLLIVLVLGVSVYSLTISYTDIDGTTRTGLQGLGAYVIPNMKGITVKQFCTVLMDAMGQLFYSLSVAMGIMIAYGSYVSDDANLGKSINQIELFDTIVAFLAGVMIIPAVFVFMGFAGNVIGAIFFAMVFFAALTSAVSIMEAIVSSFMDEFKLNRNKATAIETVIGIAVAVIVCLGYNKLLFDIKLPNGVHAQVLDIMDYVSNNVLMPIVSIGTCILIGWILKPKTVIDEVEKTGIKMGRKWLYTVMVKWVAPILLFLLLLKSLGILTII